MVERKSSADADYITGDLSVFPEILDSKYTLLDVRNNASTFLQQSVTYNGKFLVLENADAFPDFGIVRLSEVDISPKNAELVFYNKKNGNILSDLLRGFAGTRQSPWLNKKTLVTNSVNADTHNSVKDAVINIQRKLGLKEFPDPLSLNGILTSLENKYLAPRPMFAAYPRVGASPLTVRFQNFSEGHIIRTLWNFGDGSTSIERNPTHTFVGEGFYTVQLNVITSLGAQGISIKDNYIEVSNEATIDFFYVQQTSDGPPYSISSAITNSADPATFLFVDQTDGDISQRIWVFGDGEQITANDPDIHTVEHQYQSPGVYTPSLLVFLPNGTLKRVLPSGDVTVI